MLPEAQLTGGRVNYYLVQISHPQREDQQPYQAECEDIIEALELNPDEANIFKEIWRSANARKHNGKPGHTALYGAEKMVHYAGRILRRLRRNHAQKEQAHVENIARQQLSSDEALARLLRGSAGGAPGSVGASAATDSEDQLVWRGE